MIMARYDASYGLNFPTQFVKIISTECQENYIVYVIQINLNEFCWTVKHRYSEFSDLHDQLCRQWKLDRSLLPPKKLFGNISDSFVLKRKNDLEIYIQTVVKCLPSIPPPLQEFFDFPLYELRGIVKSLAKELFLRGDSMLASNKIVTINALHLHALCERLQLPEPPCDSDDSSEDLSHVVDFLSRLKQVKIKGSLCVVGTSNIIPNLLGFDLMRFKNLTSLTLIDYDSSRIKGISNVRKTVENLHYRNGLKSLQTFLMCEVLHADIDEVSQELIWPKLKNADFSFNRLRSLDKSIRLLKVVEKLCLSNNELSEINFMECLPSLRYLDLSYNHFCLLENLHTRLGNIVHLNLSDNQLEHLTGFSKLYSLHSLDLTANRVSQLNEVAHLSRLPCMENLSFVANPVTMAIDYRTKVLELFESRAAELCLDNEYASAKELDTVAVRVALKRAKLGAAVQE